MEVFTGEFPTQSPNARSNARWKKILTLFANANFQRKIHMLVGKNISNGRWNKLPWMFEQQAGCFSLFLEHKIKYSYTDSHKANGNEN